MPPTGLIGPDGRPLMDSQAELVDLPLKVTLHFPYGLKGLPTILCDRPAAMPEMVTALTLAQERVLRKWAAEASGQRDLEINDATRVA